MMRSFSLLSWLLLWILAFPSNCPGDGGLSPEFLRLLHARVETQDRALLLDVELMSQVAENAKLRRELVSRLNAPDASDSRDWSRKVLKCPAESTFAEQVAAAIIAAREGKGRTSSLLRAAAPEKARVDITARMKFLSDLEAATSYTLPLMRVRPELKDKFLGGLSRPLTAEELKFIRNALASGTYNEGGDPKLHRDELIFLLCLHLNATCDTDLLDHLWSTEWSLGIPSLLVQRMKLLEILAECRGYTPRRWTLSKFRELRDAETLEEDDRLMLGGAFYYLQR